MDTENITPIENFKIAFTLGEDLYQMFRGVIRDLNCICNSLCIKRKKRMGRLGSSAG